MYCELHCHSHYSLLDGASSPDELVARAIELGMPALGLTDHDGLYGAVQMWRAARKAGLHLVVGAEVTLTRGSHLTLLAETQQGYAHLSELLSRGQLAGEKGAPQLSIDDVAEFSGGLLCLSGCAQGALARALLEGNGEQARRSADKLLQIFGRERLWIEVQRHFLPNDARLSAELFALADTLGVPAIATNDVHYAVRDGHRLHDVLTATRYNQSLNELGPRRRQNSEFYLKSEPEMAQLFADRPAAWQATQALAERCQVSVDFSNQRLPAFPPKSTEFPYGIAEGETAFSMLHALCQQHLPEFYQPVTPSAVRQLAHELAVIQAAGLADYFLIVWDIVRFARCSGIRCQGRGSAANSMVAYLLGITPVDPLRYNLLFERFLSDRTDTMPDIDIDFASDRRDEVIAYVYERYGADHAAMVCNVVTYQRRSALRDMARAMDFPADAVNEMARVARHRFPSHYGPVGGVKDDMAQGSAPPEGYLETMQEAAFPVPPSSLIETPRHLSVHVGGILVTAQPLVQVVPLEKATKTGIVVAQWNKDSVEDAGLIKIDLLSLRTLGMITEILGLIQTRYGEALDIDRLPHDDPAVYRLLELADTIGCFQVESRAQSQMLPRLKPTCFEDLIIQVSIVRPGPIQGGMVHPYLRRRQGLEPVVYLHPSLEPVLSETLGVIIFQEQVIRVAVALAGFTPGEADMLRRAMSRSRSRDAMNELRVRFVAGALKKEIPAEVSEEAFNQLQGFATYGFCKSHAAAFALIAYQTLWLKLYYPTELFCALLNNQPMGFYTPDVVIGDVKRHGITVLRPDINASLDKCTIESAPGEKPQRLRLGLRYLYGLGESGRERLLAARGDRPFTSLVDFCRRTRLPKPLVEDCIRAGALDGLGGPLHQRSNRQLLWALGGLSYEEEMLVTAPDAETELPALDDWEALSWDYELLGLSPDDHAFNLLRPQLKAEGVVTAIELEKLPAGTVVKVAGKVAVRQRPPTAKGHVFITLEDETGLANLIIRPDLYERQRDEIDTPMLIATGKLQRQGVALSVLVRDVRRMRR
jgi:error-prone DNA polymerase